MLTGELGARGLAGSNLQPCSNGCGSVRREQSSQTYFADLLLLLCLKTSLSSVLVCLSWCDGSLLQSAPGALTDGSNLPNLAGLVLGHCSPTHLGAELRGLLTYLWICAMTHRNNLTD